MQHVQTLHAEAYPEIFRRALDPESTARFFADIVTQDRNIVLVASIDERTIGYVWCEERVSASVLVLRHEHEDRTPRRFL